MPTVDGNGVIDLTKATVKKEIVKEVLDTKKGAVVELNATDPTIETAPTKPGLVYTFRESTTLEGFGELKPAAPKVGDGEKWLLPISEKGGNSAFYSIGVGKGE